MWGSRLAAIVAWTASLAGGTAARSRGDAITPWAGAGVEVQAVGRASSATGATAVQSAEGEDVVEFSGNYDESYRYKVSVRGAATAEASGRPEGLLRVDTSYSTGNPGTRPTNYWGPRVRASATWTDDAVHVSSPDGVDPPESVRLHLALEFGPLTFGSSRFTFNGSVLEATEYSSEFPGTWYRYRPGDAGDVREVDDLRVLPEGIDSYDLVSEDGSGLRRRFTFHLDLPVDDEGGSRPFSLGLDSDLSVGLIGNYQVVADHRDFTVSLTDVTLPDGTPLASRGQAVSFASGLPWPQPVPEPASLAVWGLVASFARAVGAAPDPSA